MASEKILRHKLDPKKDHELFSQRMKGIKQVEVTSAAPINKENEHEIIKELNKIVKGDLEIKKKVDENLIGGVIIQVEDQMIDASIKSNLEQLKKDLIQ